MTAVPDVCDISGETKETRDLYGVDSNDAINGSLRQTMPVGSPPSKGGLFIELSCLTVESSRARSQPL